MKISVVILAGGIGSRMKTDIPKQFISIDGIPIIIHTLLNFEKNDRINDITIVCLKDYISEMEKNVKLFGLTKIRQVIEGGKTGHDSTRNGVLSYKDILHDGDFIIIHDAVRPILPQKILNSMIDTALKNGNACLAIPCYETVVLTKDKICGNKEISRDSFLRVQTPQMYSYNSLKRMYEMAEKDNRHDFIYANTMFLHYGGTIFFSPGFNYNFKITTPEDLPLYKTLLECSDDILMR